MMIVYISVAGSIMCCMMLIVAVHLFVCQFSDDSSASMPMTSMAVAIAVIAICGLYVLSMLRMFDDSVSFLFDWDLIRPLPVEQQQAAGLFTWISQLCSGRARVLRRLRAGSAVLVLVRSRPDTIGVLRFRRAVALESLA